MTPCRARAILAFLLGGSLAAVFAPAALAVEERGWFSLEAGALVYDPEQALRDGPALSLRATWFLNRWIGVEGLAQTASPTQDPTALGDATFTHVGGGLVATPDRHGWALPYLYAGYGSVSVDRDGFASENAGAFHGGVGAVFRMGERIGLRLDARDVTYEQQSGPGRDSTRVHSFQIAAGVTLFYFGRPRDTDEDGVPNKGDRSPGTPRGAVVDATGTPLDGDKDGVFDGLDTSPATPPGAKVDATGVAIDSDGDGVPDGIDVAAETPKGVVVDATGTPLDTDQDGVFDGLDRCADTPRGSKVDASGCPLDADGDGVPDGIDICPFTPAGAPVNAGGCPVAPTRYERQLLEDWGMTLTDLQFVPDSSRLLPEGMARVDSIGIVLQQWPMLKVEVGAHIDDQLDEPKRQPVSHLRARNVLQYLYSKFPTLIAKNYWYTGYGGTQPLAPNKTPDGRAANRRVEFRLMSMQTLSEERARREALGTVPVPPAPGLIPAIPQVPQEAPPEAPKQESPK